MRSEYFQPLEMYLQYLVQIRSHTFQVRKDNASRVFECELLWGLLLASVSRLIRHQYIRTQLVRHFVTTITRQQNVYITSIIQLISLVTTQIFFRTINLLIGTGSIHVDMQLVGMISFFLQEITVVIGRIISGVHLYSYLVCFYIQALCCHLYSVSVRSPSTIVELFDSKVGGL